MMQSSHRNSTGASALQSTVMHHLLDSQGNGTVRSREDFLQLRQLQAASMAVNNFHPAASVSGELVDWNNSVTSEGFSSSLNGSAYGFQSSFMSPNIHNSSPNVCLKCPECKIIKMNSEDLEIHIKMEHLQWLPFVCPICNAERAMNFQLREHINCSHRKDSNKFLFVDNHDANRILRKLMDYALIHARSVALHQQQQQQQQQQHQQHQQQRKHTPAQPSSSTSINSGRMPNRTGEIAGSCPESLACVASPLIDEATMRAINALTAPAEHQSSAQNSAIPPAAATVIAVSKKRPACSNESTMHWNTSTDAVLSAIRVITQENDEGPSQEDSSSNRDTVDGSDDITTLFKSKQIKSECSTMDESGVNATDDVALPATTDSPGETQDPAQILDNVAAMFNAEEADVSRRRRRGANGVYTSDRSKANASRYQPLYKKTKSLSKKRVLGQCGACKKPVTAGARQMHMFFHLGKDHNTYRFQCKYPGCKTEHYRKDQMENHHSKVHGRIDPSLMLDRTAELFSTCQKLSMDLLGTTGNVPGPTAAKAQAIYDANLANAAHNPRRKRKAQANIYPPSTSNQTVSVSAVAVATPGVNLMPERHAAEDSGYLDCQLCRKVLPARIRGFHILHHMAKDLGICRFKCKLCPFANERSQTVQTHGKKEHNDEDCVDDRIEDYSDEVKQMSESCFGSYRAFHSDNRKRKHFSDTTDNSSEDGGSLNGDGGEVETSLDAQEPDMVVVNIAPPQQQRSYRDRQRKYMNRRFGIRKPPSRVQRREMLKMKKISLFCGGAQYYKKRANDVVFCQICNEQASSRMSEHACKHLKCQLFLCPHCDIGDPLRETVIKHIRDFHSGEGEPVDERIRYQDEIKDIIHQCYPAYYVDAPIPTLADFERLKASLEAEDNMETSPNDERISPIDGPHDLDDEVAQEQDEMMNGQEEVAEATGESSTVETGSAELTDDGEESFIEVDDEAMEGESSQVVEQENGRGKTKGYTLKRKRNVEEEDEEEI